MEKTIDIGGKSVRLNNNIGWLRAYRSQFGQDIMPSIMPLIATVIDLMGAFLDENENAEVTVASMIRAADSDKMLNAIVHASTFELLDLINITWALAKCADPDIPDPETWEKQFEIFPFDIVVPAVWKLVVEGFISSKNLARLENVKIRLQPIEKTNN